MIWTELNLPAAAGLLALGLGLGFVFLRHRGAPPGAADQALHSLHEGVITTDADDHVTYMNPAAETLTGWDCEAARSQPLGRVFHLITENAEERFEAEAVGGQLQLVRRDGRPVPIQMSTAPLRDGIGSPAGSVVSFRDATSERDAARQLLWQASHDPLTGLENRRAFERKLVELVEESKTGPAIHVLLYLDLDQFKVINDTNGHPAGDAVLRQVSAILRPRLRRSDVFARLGGDEFGVLLRGCPIDVGRQTAETLRRAIAAHRFTWEDKTFEITASIGFVAIADGAKTPAQLLSQADAACYVAKDDGRNRAQEYFGGKQCTRKHDEMEWVLRINRALQEDRFVLYYQAIVPVGGVKAGAVQNELLLRMIGENGELIPPMAFIPAAEKYNLMPAIDRWVLREVLRRLAAGRGGADVRATWSINLSGQSLCDDDFLAFVISGIKAADVDPARICLEITETAAVRNLARAQRFITELKLLGCSFALDDFGSGMSSYAYLKSLAVDFVKIDGAFVRNIAHDDVDSEMVESVNRIAHVMGMQTVAEFVEDEHILARLREIGVDYAQGYHIHKPEALPHTE